MASVNNSIYDYLKHGLVVNVFYLRNRDMRYLFHGTKSLSRKYLTQERDIKVCEYRVYKVLTFFDCIRGTKCHGTFVSVFKFTLVDYLLDYILTGCTIDCTECQDFDFSTYYLKNNLLNDFTRVKDVFFGEYEVFRKQEFPERRPSSFIVGKSSDIIYSMMLLDFDRVYRVVGLRRIPSRYNYLYIITLFDYVEHLDNYSHTTTLFDYEEHLKNYMISDFWLPKSCLPEIKGSKYVNDNNGVVDIWENQFIRVVDTKTYKGNKYVVIKSFTVKSITQLRKPL